MIDRRKMIDALLLLEMTFIRLASLVERFFLATGQGLRSLMRGRRGRSLLSHKQIYARNLFRFGKMDRPYRPSGGLYIRRYGWLGATRWLVVGQDRKDS